MIQWFPGLKGATVPETGACSDNSLEAMAAKCRKLASALADQRATDALTRLAEDYERQVQNLDPHSTTARPLPHS